jgi:hypothetical protein
MAAYKMAAVKVTPPNDFPLGLIRSHMVFIHLFLMLCDLQRVVRDLCPTLYIFPHGATATSGPGPPHYRGLMITLRHITLGRTSLDEWSACHRDLYLTTHNTEIAMSPDGTRTWNPREQGPQTHALDPRGHWDRHVIYSRTILEESYCNATIHSLVKALVISSLQIFFTHKSSNNRK